MLDLIRIGMCLSACVTTATGAEHLPAGCQSHAIAAAKGLPYGYAVRPGIYCDGSLPINNKGELQVVSFTLGPVTFGAGQRHLLLSRLGDGTEVLHVSGLDKRGSGSYRLDGIVPVSGLPLDLDAAIRPKQLVPNDLGFIAWIDRGIDRFLVPILAGAPAAAHSVAFLVLRAPDAVIEASVQICSRGGTCGQMKTIGQDLPADSLIEVSLPRINTMQVLELKLQALGPGNRLTADVIKVMVP